MPDSKKHHAVLAAIAAAILGGISLGVVLSGDDDDDELETPIIGSDLDRASAAALAHTGGGRVTETEVGDEESYYEVEVTLENGRQVDVQLDQSFRVVGSESDDEDELDD